MNLPSTDRDAENRIRSGCNCCSGVVRGSILDVAKPLVAVNSDARDGTVHLHPRFELEDCTPRGQAIHHHHSRTTTACRDLVRISNLHITCGGRASSRSLFRQQLSPTAASLPQGAGSVCVRAVKLKLLLPPSPPAHGGATTRLLPLVRRRH